MGGRIDSVSFQSNKTISFSVMELKTFQVTLYLTGKTGECMTHSYTRIWFYHNVFTNNLYQGLACTQRFINGFLLSKKKISIYSIHILWKKNNKKSRQGVYSGRFCVIACLSIEGSTLTLWFRPLRFSSGHPPSQLFYRISVKKSHSYSAVPQ